MGQSVPYSGSRSRRAAADTSRRAPPSRRSNRVSVDPSGGRIPALLAAPHRPRDGQAYFQVVAALAAAHAEGGKFDAAQQKALPDFDAASCWEASCAGALDARARNEPTLWLPFRLLESTTPLWALGEAAG